MKTKQEQIEAMQKDFCKACKDNFPNGFVCPWQSNLTRCSQCEIVCEIFYQAGYGDVSEYKAEIERLKNEMSDIRKKTAEKFAKRICEMLWNLGIDGSGNRFSYGDLTSKEVLYVAKQFGVDIDDCLCKENTIATAHINKLVEQDAEIERLTEVIKNYKEVLCETTQRKDDAIKRNDTIVEEYENKIKQAQIDVLNKLRSRISDRDSLIQSYIADGCLTIENMYTEIDELIAGVEDAKSKGTN